MKVLVLLGRRNPRKTERKTNVATRVGVSLNLDVRSRTRLLPDPFDEEAAPNKFENDPERAAVKGPAMPKPR